MRVALHEEPVRRHGAYDRFRLCGRGRGEVNYAREREIDVGGDAWMQVLAQGVSGAGVGVETDAWGIWEGWRRMGRWLRVGVGVVVVIVLGISGMIVAVVLVAW